MFSGIIEATSDVISLEPRGDVYILRLRRPPAFDDLKTGDSISTNGVCLTVEVLGESFISFALGVETVNVTKWNELLKPGTKVNLERSLKYGDRVHGHFVTGHVEAVAEVVELIEVEEGRGLRVRLPHNLLGSVWKKGSVALNGVSLTINEVEGVEISVWLIPETLVRTNLSSVKVGDAVLVETDYLAKAILRSKEFSRELDS